MAEIIRITWIKLAIILFSVVVFVIGFAYCESHYDNKKSINDIEAVEDVARIETQVSFVF